MKWVNWDKNSIVYKLTSFVIFIIIVQTILLTATMIAGGVLSQGRENAYNSFNEKVNNRKDYIQREMKNRWTNMDPYVAEISSILSENKGNDIFFKEAINHLISMLRTTQTSGEFIILDGEKTLEEGHSALYLRDYDPILNDYSNKDLYFVAGSAQLAKDNKIPLDAEWKYTINLDEDNKGFYEKPLLKAALTSNANLLGYWSVPFRLYPKDIEIITYSMPLFDSDNRLRGIIGIEISLSYLTQYLPSSDIQQKDSLGYLVGFEGGKETGIRPIIMSGAFQSRMIPDNEVFSLKDTESGKNVHIIENANSKEAIYVCIEKIGLYNHNTPFEDEQWYLVGIMTENHLFSYVLKIKRILWIALCFSIFIGIVGGYIISYRFTKPIIRLAKQVRESDKDKAIKLEPTGLTEVDQLSNAMEIANNELLESTVKMSRIIDLVEVPIGAFEYKEKSERVFVTDQLQQILSFEKEEMVRIINKKNLFIQKINEILTKPEPEEEGVYKTSDNPEKWILIKTVISGKSTLGVVRDVTDEILEKKKIKKDRDFDPLTKIYNRKAVQRHIEDVIYKSEKLETAALLMFDLDNLKSINDTYGHKWGDLYIKAAVDQLKTIGDSSHMILGRRSGDEFVLFLYGYINREAIRTCIEAFYENLKNEPLTLPDGKSKLITFSSGLKWVGGANLAYDDLLHLADEALYQSKNFHKGNCFESEL